jgi:hypothetical protein
MEEGLSDMGHFIRMLRSWRDDLRGRNKKATAGVDGLPADMEIILFQEKAGWALKM